MLFKVLYTKTVNIYYSAIKYNKNILQYLSHQI